MMASLPQPVQMAQVTGTDAVPKGHSVVAGRWKRMVLRALSRFAWSRESVHLWLLKHPELRFLPIPYPSVASVGQWQLQAFAMAENGAYPRKWLGRGLYMQGTLAAVTWVRSRVGLTFAFLEDLMLTGMLAARPQHVRQARIRHAALKEEAAKAMKDSERLRAARTLIGPKGGLPSLKSDLVRLATLLHVETAEKDTVAQLRNLLKPAVSDLCVKLPYQAADGCLGVDYALRELYDLSGSIVEAYGADLSSELLNAWFASVSRPNAKSRPAKLHECFTATAGGSACATPSQHGLAHEGNGRPLPGYVRAGAYPRHEHASGHYSGSARCRDGGAPGRYEQRMGDGGRDTATANGPSPASSRMPGAERNLKSGHRQLVSQAWDRHRRDCHLLYGNEAP